jgi:hypothetical protein
MFVCDILKVCFIRRTAEKMGDIHLTKRLPQACITAGKRAQEESVRSPSVQRRGDRYGT